MTDLVILWNGGFIGYHTRFGNKSRVTNNDYNNDPVVITYLDKRYVVPDKWTFETDSKGGKVYPHKEDMLQDYAFWPWHLQTPGIEDDDLQIGSEKTELTEEEREQYKTMVQKDPKSVTVAHVKWVFVGTGLFKTLDVNGPTFTIF